MDKDSTIKTDGKVCLVISSSFNNTIITPTRINGEKIGNQESGRTATGYKGSAKATPLAVQAAAKKILKRLKESGVSQVKIKTQGFGRGLTAALETICNEPNIS